MTACLDSWAVLAWLDGDEPARTRLDELLDERPIMSWINAVEVSYRIERQHGREEAETVMSEIRKAFELELPGVVRMLETARLKAAIPVALADCFAIATATAHGVPLLSGDPEIVDRDDLPCSVEDLRA
ncbi:MAG TPA: PIN domain-containing protein [Solirubrobacteraceae bacterium]